MAEAEERPGAGAPPAKAVPRQPPWEREALPAEGGGSFGSWLRRQREMREISLREIAERTKISLRYLEAMEADRFDLLPAPIFAKGFLKEFARYVGLSPDDVVNHYLSVHKPEDSVAGAEEVRVRVKSRSSEPIHTPMRRSWSYGSLLALAGLVLLILVAVAAYFADHRRESPDPEQTPPIAAPPPTSPPPAAAVAAPQLPAPTSPLTVSLDFSQDCWVEALLDGKQRLSELRVQGEALQLDAQKSVALTLGNAGAVSVHVNGLPFDLDRKQGDVVRDLVIDLETLKTLREKRGSAAP